MDYFEAADRVFNRGFGERGFPAGAGFVTKAPDQGCRTMALFIEDLPPLLSALPDLDLQDFRYVSIHAPSQFEPSLEGWVVDCLLPLAERLYPVIVHPDILFTPALWSRLGSQLLIENMDRRKTGRQNCARVGSDI